MKVRELVDQLLGLVNEGLGEENVLIYDPDADDWMPVTGIAYSHTNGARLYADES